VRLDPLRAPLNELVTVHSRRDSSGAGTASDGRRGTLTVTRGVLQIGLDGRQTGTA
jgi:hypothetical protein